jgi:diaminohydroxyphosphoribosylaminopyrimidine deaminase / 5-amino-6-(5-phosphoribosylamino)uracil reductase
MGEGRTGLRPDRRTDRQWMRRAIELAHRCAPVPGAYSVGAVLVDAHGAEIAHGWSRETDGGVHAEESALSKLDPHDPRLASATLYSSLEPCSSRASRPRPCSGLVLDAGIPRVVIAWREPDLFVARCVGVETLREHGVEVVVLDELADAAREPNRHLGV